MATQCVMQCEFSDAEFIIRDRMNQACASEELQGAERAVLCALGQAFGKDKAVGIAEMQDQWRERGQKIYDDRTIKAAVKSLLEVWDIPIGSCRVPGQSGYYLVTSDDEAEDAVRPLKNEIFSLFRRIKALSPKSAFVRQLQGQMDLVKGSDGL